MKPRISDASKTATTPGFVPPYQNVIAIADKANAANACGKWKRVNIRSSASAPVTEAIANPYGTARDTSCRAIHFVTLRLAIIQQFLSPGYGFPAKDIS